MFSSFVVLFFLALNLALTIATFFIITGGSDEFTLQVVDVTLVIKEVLLLVTFDLNTSQSLLCQVFWVIDIDHILIIFTLDTTLIVLLLFLQGYELRLGQVVHVELALALITHVVLIILTFGLLAILVILELLLHLLHLFIVF